MSKAKIPAVRVNYASHLFWSAVADVRTSLSEQWWLATILAGPVFFGAALAAYAVRGAGAGFVVPFLMGTAGVLLAVGMVFAAHFLYLTPRRLCAVKQSQLDEERREFAASLEVEVLRRREAIAERDRLQSKLTGRFSDRAA